MTRPQPRYQPSDRIADRYQVHHVKMGGMGEVYLCLDLEEMYPYALKTFQSRYQSDALRQAFETEVATWVALEKHPNIVRCFYMKTLGNQPFMILEWVSGEEGRGTDLRSHLRHGPMTLNQSLKLILDLCYGLQHAQQKQPGLVHRDLKPENILIAKGGQAKITDFGLAHVVATAELIPDDDELLTNSGQTMMSRKGIAGTPSCMAPEQWRGEPLDQRTDIYGLGCIWVEMLTGQPPFTLGYQPNTPQEIDQWLNEIRHQHEQAKRPDLGADIPAPVNDLIQACLAQDPTERPTHLANLIEQLKALYHSLINETPPQPHVSGEMTSGDYVNRGNTYDALGQIDQALQDYTKAISLDPSLTLAYYNLGATYHDLGQFDKALGGYNQAISLDPYDAHVYYNRGLTYQDLGQSGQALQDYTKAISLDPTYINAYINTGLLFYSLNRVKEALPYFEKAAQLGDREAFEIMTQIRQQLGYEPVPPTYPVLGAFEALAQAGSLDEVRQLITNHSILIEAKFIDVITQAIAEIPADQQPAYQQRLTWLQQIIQEQTQ